ncbi:MAG: M20/M25/M40 family metallo-hydrolase [Proteobacteria bacterium]|nr:M20/M25/M40 family metallo-hydrolase [Pseudomonadota bacterium]
MYRRPFVSAAGALLLAGACHADTDAGSNALAHDIFKELIEINTTESVGSVTTASEAMAKRLRAAGFSDSDIQIVGDNPRKKNLVVRLHGSGKHKPVLLIGHLDVVEARREDWTTDPFKFVEKDGRFYGRGTQDMKNGDAIMVSTLIRLKKEGFEPSRDIILALTADEESGDSNGVEWLLKNRRDLVDAQFVINHDGDSITSEHGKPLYFEMDGTEKVYADYLLTATNPGGHSSLPVPDNAIYHITGALDRLAHYEFPFELNSVTRAYYERQATLESGQRAADMKAILQTPPDPKAVARLSQDTVDHSLMRTTCVATRLQGGHANNALPQRATANVNCRIFPGHSPEEIRHALIEVFADPAIKVQSYDAKGVVVDKASDKRGYPPPPLIPEVMKPLDTLVAQMWPGLKVIPAMSAGASDGVYTSAAGLPTYGIAGIAIDKDNIRAHGQDENIGIESFDKGNEFFYRYMKLMTSH